MINRANQKIIIIVILVFASSFVFSKYTIYNSNDREPIYPKSSAAPIYVDDSRENYNWEKLKSNSGCTGSGTEGDPYVIKDKIIDGSGWKNGIWIENSQAYFIIHDCKLTNCGQEWTDGGIKLVSVQNGVINNNNCTGNSGSGIYLQASRYNELIGNEVSHNEECGIYLWQCSDNIVSNNDVHDNIETRNGRAGIKLGYGNRNQMIENEVSNQWVGIYISGDVTTATLNNISQNLVRECGNYGVLLDEAHNNYIPYNAIMRCSTGVFLRTANNNRVEYNVFTSVKTCVYQLDCSGNIIENNTCNQTETGELIGFGLWFLPLILASLLAITTRCALKVKRKRKTSSSNITKRYRTKN